MLTPRREAARKAAMARNIGHRSVFAMKASTGNPVGTRTKMVRSGAPKMPSTSFMDSARDGSGRSRGQVKNNSLMSAARSANSREASDLAAAKKASARARKAGALSGGKGAKHRPAGSPSGGQFF